MLCIIGCWRQGAHSNIGCYCADSHLPHQNQLCCSAQQQAILVTGPIMLPCVYRATLVNGSKDWVSGMNTMTSLSHWPNSTWNGHLNLPLWHHAPALTPTSQMSPVLIGGVWWRNQRSVLGHRYLSVPPEFSFNINMPLLLFGWNSRKATKTSM